jgi:periplasmic divalent cation tolerance protein
MERVSTGTYVVLSTVGSLQQGGEIAERLVGEGLAACVNIIPGLSSVYRWKGEVQRDEEVLLLIKTTAHRYRELEAKLREIHSYETPEIVALEVTEGLQAYLDWVGVSVERGPSEPDED